MRPVGFSTGALGLGDTDHALSLLHDQHLSSIEFSALRWDELEPVAQRLGQVRPGDYEHVSFHAPSAFTAEQEPALVAFLCERIPASVTIVVHPDSIKCRALWGALGSRLALENMDRRKDVGRNVEELDSFFNDLPEARFCFDVGHARQWDPSMTQAYRLLRAFRDRLVQLHVSEVATNSQHDRLSETAILAFAEIADLVPNHVPLIIESRVSGNEISAEVARVNRAFPPNKSV